MLKILTTCGLAFILFTPLSHAQTAPLFEDEVISRGQLRGSDPAMDAFLKGDYAVAEIEFQKNFEALRRIQRIRDDAFLQARGNILANNINTLNLQSASNDGTTVGQTLTPTNRLGITVLRHNDVDDKNIISSGRDVGVQLYMKGLSQIQLKKYDEAKASFKSALRLSKSVRLHDARMRLGLLELRDGRPDEAKRQLRALEKLSKRCRYRCEQKAGVKVSTDTLRWALDKV